MFVSLRIGSHFIYSKRATSFIALWLLSDPPLCFSTLPASRIDPLLPNSPIFEFSLLSLSYIESLVKFLCVLASSSIPGFIILKKNYKRLFEPNLGHMPGSKISNVPPGFIIDDSFEVTSQRNFE